MIGVQKRKATCSPSTINNNEPAQNAANQTKSLRKKAKLTGSRSSGSSNLATKRPTSTLTETCHYESGSSPSNPSNQDESVWIFGLINNIEQLLSTFTAINNTSSSSTKLSSSGASTPSAPPSSLASSTAPSPPSSINSSLESTNPMNTTICNTSTFSSSSSSSSSPCSSSSSSSPPSSSSSVSSASGSMPAAQQVAASLPRSPVSRQIKFHEYKGPPSVKRQQQSVKQQSQQSATTNGSLTSSASLQSSNEMSNKKISLAAPAPNLLLVPQLAQQQQKQADVNNAQLVSGTPIAQQQPQQRDQAIIASQKGAVSSQLGSFSATIPQANALCNVSLQQNQMSANPQPHSLAAVKLQAHIMQQNQQQQHAPRRHSHLGQQQQQQQQQPIQVTSGTSRCSPASIQTFYIKQESDIPLESPLNRLTLTEQSNQQLDDHHHHHHHHQQQQQQQQRCRLEQMQHLQFPISNVEFSQLPSQRVCDSIMMRTIQQPSNNLPASSVSLSHASEDQEHQRFGQQAATRMIQAQQRPAGSTCRHQQSQVHQQLPQYHLQHTIYANANHYAPTACSVTAATSTNQLISYTGDRYGANSEGYSPSTNQHIDDDELAASFGPECEETDACDIEPSIEFTSGIDELLFSEFIDLQDVPMNVDESDWLKKFLPPCSMG